MDGGSDTTNVGNKHTKDTKILGGILGVLCVAIVGLTVGIIVTNISTKNTTTDTPQDSEITAQLQQMEEWSNEYDEFSTKYNSLKSSAKAKLEQAPPDVAAADSLYTELINEYLDQGDEGRAMSLVNGEMELFSELGLNNEAAEIMANKDYGRFSDSAKYWIYRDIITLANQVGRTDIVQKYEPMAAAVKYAYDQNMAAIEELSQSRADSDNQQVIETVRGSNE